VLFHRVDVRYDQRLGSDARLRAAVTVGVDSTRGTQGLVRNVTAGGRLELRARLGARALLRAGGSLSVDRYRLTLDPNTQSYLDVLELFPGRTDTVLGGYADLVLTPAPGIEITPGVRLDHYRSLGQSELGVSPRLAATFQVGEGVSIGHVLGVAHQPPSFVQGIPGVAVAGLPGGLQRSVQTSAGVRAALTPELQMGVTSFYNAYFRLTDPFSLSQDLDLDAEEARIRSIGRAVGLELSLERRLFGGFGGMLSYTLSRSMRSHGRVRSLSGYDRPHVLNLALSYDLGKSWLASGRALFYSGVPGSRRLGNRRIFDRERAHPFFRLDLKLEKRLAFGDGAYLAIAAEAINATLSQEVLRRPCEPDCRDVTVGPIVLPSLGVNGRF
jgi:hypothetical protein